MSYALYAYVTALGAQDKIGARELNWTGTFSPSGTYSPATYDAALYNDDRFIAILSNVGVNPTAKLPNRQPNPWSRLVIYQPGDEPPFPPPSVPQGNLFTVGPTSTSQGTVAVSFAGSHFQTVVLSGDGTLVSANRAGGASVSAYIQSDGTAHALYFHPEWKWLGFDPSVPTAFDAGQIAMVSLVTFGTNEADVVAFYQASA